MPGKTILEEAIDEFLLPRGFDKLAGRRWRRKMPEVLQLVSLGKHTFGNAYFLQLGINLLAIENEQEPKPWNLHVAWNPISFMPNKLRMLQARIENLADRTITREERQQGLQNVLKKYVIPIFNAYDSQKKVMRFLKFQRSRTWPTPLITISAESALVRLEKVNRLNEAID